MEEGITNLFPESKLFQEKLITEKRIKKIKELLYYVVDLSKKGHYIESSIVLYQLTQDILLVDLRNVVMHKLNLQKVIQKFNAETNSYRINLEYLALTHDIELFNLLEKARKLRNEIIHEIPKHETLDISKEKAKKAHSFMKTILLAIIDRLKGKKPIPVLTLYAKGWNDYREQAIKTIESL